jgi:hypothetical protein
MERRRFLGAMGVGALGAGAGVAVPGCAGVQVRPELGARETTALLGRLERGLGAAREPGLGGIASLEPWRLRPASTENVLRLGAEALVVADVARSIPSGVRVPRELAQRLEASVPILDDCVATYHALLASTPAAVRRNVDRRFRDEPEVAMRVAEHIDGRSSEVGVSPESRLRLRTAAANVTSRIRRQSASAVIDDCTSKVASVVARSGIDLTLARSTTTTAMIEGIWQEVEGSTQLGGSPPVPPPPPPTIAAAEPSQESPGDSELIVGGILVGSGLAVFGIGTLIGWAAGSAAWGAVISATPGGILVIIGVVLLIVGAVQNGEAQ